MLLQAYLNTLSQSLITRIGLRGANYLDNVINISLRSILDRVDYRPEQGFLSFQPDDIALQRALSPVIGIKIIMALCRVHNFASIACWLLSVTLWQCVSPF
jgi:hypothetical protein